MARTVRLVVAVVALLAATSSAADAVIWHASGDTAFTATSSGTKTLTTSPVGGIWGHITCTGGIDASGTSVSGTTTGFVGPPITGTLSFTSCVSLTAAAGVDCAYRFTPQTQTFGATTGQFDTTCSVYLLGTKVCHAEGGLHATYFNPSGGASGRFTITPGSLALTFVPGTSCPYGDPPSPLGPLGFHETTLAITTAAGGPAPHTGPVLIRTP